MISFWQLLIVFLIVVLVFGPARLEKLGPSLGKAIRGFKKGIGAESEEEAEKEATKKRLASQSTEKDETGPKDS